MSENVFIPLDPVLKPRYRMGDLVLVAVPAFREHWEGSMPIPTVVRHVLGEVLSDGWQGVFSGARAGLRAGDRPYNVRSVLSGALDWAPERRMEPASLSLAGEQMVPPVPE